MSKNLIGETDYKLEQWLSRSYGIISTGIDICKISVVFVLLAYILEGTVTSGSSIFGIYSEIPSAVQEGIVPLALTGVFVFIDNIKRNIPRKPTQFRYVDLTFGVIIVSFSGYGYFRLFDYIDGSQPENMIVALPWIIFFSGLLTINAGIVINGLSRLVSQPIYIVSNRHKLRNEIGSLFRSVKQTANIVKAIRRIAKTNDESYPHTFKKAVRKGIDSIDNKDQTGQKGGSRKAKRDPVSDQRLVSSHKNIIIAYLAIMSFSLCVVFYDIDHEYRALITLVAMFFIFTAPLGVLSGIFRDSDYVSYVSYEWDIEPFFYLFLFISSIILFFVAVIVLLGMFPRTSMNTSLYFLT